MPLQDITVTGRTDAGKLLTFSHPAFQSACMFLGEFLCLIPFLCSLWAKQRQKGHEADLQNPEKRTLRQKLVVVGIFALPALLDSGATTLLNVGLILT